MSNPQLKFPGPDKLFFTGDTHFGHKNIIKYCNRPFDDVEQMNEQLIERWNAVVPSKGATVIHLGDVFLCSVPTAETILHRLHGSILWVPGNHDKTAWGLANHVYRSQFGRLPELCEITVKDGESDQPIVLCHYALRVWNRSHHGAWHLYGHSHSGLKNDLGELMQDYEYTLSMDVGVDCNNYQPFTYEQIKKHMAQKKFRPSDHHSAVRE